MKLIKFTIERIKNFLFPIRHGATFTEDERDFKASDVPEESILSKDVDTFNTHVKNQGFTNRCTAYAMALLIEIMLTIKLRKKVYVDGDVVWEIFLKEGASEKTGFDLRGACNAVVKHGVPFNNYNEDGSVN